MRRVISLTTLVASAGVVVGGSVGAVGCARELRRFDLDVSLVEAESVEGSVDDANIDLLTRLFADGEEQNGGAERELVLDTPTINDDTAAIRVEVEARDGDFNLVALGSSATVSAPALGETLDVEILLAPAEPDLLTSLPPSLGGDACMADDGLGGVFLVGGSGASQSAYVLRDGIEVDGLPGDFPQGVPSVGCGANRVNGEAMVAAIGGCSGSARPVAVTLTASGQRTTLDVADLIDGNLCGAAALPRQDGRLWILSSRGEIFHVGERISDATTVRTFLDDPQRQGLEVTAQDALVAILDGVLTYANDEQTITLGTAVALGRRGADVLVLDGDGTVSVVEDSTTRSTGITVDVTTVIHFVVLDDDTFVGLGQDGRTITVDGPAGQKTFSAKSAGHTRVSALPGGAVVISGADADGIEVMAPPRTP